MTKETEKIVASRKAKYNLYCIWFREDDVIHPRLLRAYIKNSDNDSMTIVIRNLTQKSSREFNMTDDEVIIKPDEMNSLILWGSAYQSRLGIFDKETKCKNAFRRYLNKQIDELNDKINSLNVVYEKVYARDMNKIHV